MAIFTEITGTKQVNRLRYFSDERSFMPTAQEDASIISRTAKDFIINQTIFYYATRNSNRPEGQNR